MKTIPCALTWWLCGTANEGSALVVMLLLWNLGDSMQDREIRHIYRRLMFELNILPNVLFDHS